MVWGWEGGRAVHSEAGGGTNVVPFLHYFLPQYRPALTNVLRTQGGLDLKPTPPVKPMLCSHRLDAQVLARYQVGEAGVQTVAEWACAEYFMGLSNACHSMQDYSKLLSNPDFFSGVPVISLSWCRSHTCVCTHGLFIPFTDPFTPADVEIAVVVAFQRMRDTLGVSMGCKGWLFPCSTLCLISVDCFSSHLTLIVKLLPLH